MHYNQYITSGQTSYKLREHFSMMILSIVATVVLLGALFYHRVSLLLSSVILLAWTAALGAAGVWNIWLLLPLALVWLLFFADGPTSETAFWSTPEALWVVAAGPVTLVPLVCFNAAARHLPYATLGFLQYLAPTLVLLQAILLFGEHLDSSRLTAFAFIWLALAVYSFDAWRSLRRLPQPG